jgi:hypothetical protein
MVEIDIGTSSHPFTEALQRVTKELAERGYDIRNSKPQELTVARVGGQEHNFVTGLTARSRDEQAVWTVRLDWDPVKQSHVNGTWRVHGARKQPNSENFFSRFRFSDRNGYDRGIEMLQGDAGNGVGGDAGNVVGGRGRKPRTNGDMTRLWEGWKVRYFEVNPISGRDSPRVIVPEVSGRRRHE